MEKPLFTICLIARNEAKVLPRLVDSLKEFKERGGDIILLDTGSTDNTVQVAKDLGCIVEERGEEFLTILDKDLADKINEFFIIEGEEPIVKEGDRIFDFHKARNASANLSKTAMVAMPDCDEVYTKLDIDKLNEVIKQGYGQLEYNFVFSHDQYGNEAIKFLHCKFYNKDILEWTGITHEVISPISGMPTASRVYLDESIIKLEHWQNQETNRSGYLRGLALDCYQNPNYDRNSHYIARELVWSGRPKSAIKEFKRHLTLSSWPAERSESMNYIGDCYKMLGDEISAVEWWNKAFAEESGRRESLARLADHYFTKNDFQRVSCYATAMLEIAWNGFYANRHDLYTDHPHELLYWAKWYLGDKEASKLHWRKAYDFCPINPKYVYEMSLFYPQPKVSIVIPTLRKGEKLQRLLDSIKQNAGYSNYEIIVEEDNWEDRQGAPKTLKKGVEKSTGELVMFLGDDCIMKQGAVGYAVMSMYDNFPQGDGLIGLNDGYWQLGEIATHFLISKQLLPYLGGEIFYTGYSHCGCDNELTERCRMIDKYRWCKEALVYHDHPMQDGYKTEEDDVYKVAYDPVARQKDEELLEQRSKEFGFEIRRNFIRP